MFAHGWNVTRNYLNNRKTEVIAGSSAANSKRVRGKVTEKSDVGVLLEQKHGISLLLMRETIVFRVIHVSAELDAAEAPGLFPPHALLYLDALETL